MPRPEKVQAVEEIQDRFESSTATFLTEYRGLSVTQIQELRSKLREAGGQYKVYKMTLARRAAEAAGVDGLAEWLSGPTAIAFTGDDPVPVAKALKDYAGEHEMFVIKGGLLSGEIIAPEMVAKLATIEPREVLLAKMAGAFEAPLAKLAGMLQSFTRDAASMFSQLLEKKEAEGPAEAASAPAADESPSDDAEADATDEGAPADEASTDEASTEEALSDEPSGEDEAATAEDSTDEEPADGGDADGSEEE